MKHTNMNAHTPGPWKVLHTPTRKETFWAVATTNDAPIQAVIALIDAKSKAHMERPELAEANAALIASAPDLLEALTALLTWAQARCLAPASDDSWGKSAFNRANEALKKAQGAL